MKCAIYYKLNIRLNSDLVVQGKLSHADWSHEWFDDLCRLGLTPNKTKRLVLPCVPNCYIGDFVRGCFDGDGNVWVGQIHKDRVKSTKTIQVVFTSASLDFLTSLRSLLRTKGLKGGGLYTHKKGTFSRLIFSVNDALKIYKIMYNAEHKLLLNRKKQVFENFLTAVVAQLVRAPACRRAAFLSKGGLKLSGISVKAKSFEIIPNKYY